MDPIMQVGKSGVGEELITSVDNALEARELIKMSALETAPVTAREAADELAEATGADVVAVVGRRFVLYRSSKKKKKIELPK
jgi:RNA-binding protein